MSRLRRCILYVPASNSRMLLRSQKVNVDSLVYDLEDSVPPNKKLDARNNVSELLRGRLQGQSERLVRVNALGTEFAQSDLEAILQTPSLDGIVLPKVETSDHVRAVGNLIDKFATNGVAQGGQKRTKIIACIESAKAITNLKDICAAGMDKGWLDGLVFAAEDYCASVGVTRTGSLLELLYPRQALVTYAKANRISAIDLVCTDLRPSPSSSAENEQNVSTILRDECTQGREFGMTGKQAIHPSQVDTIQEIFGPNPQRVAWARRVIETSNKEAARGIGAFVVDGKVIDEPVMKEARRIADEATQAGM